MAKYSKRNSGSSQKYPVMNLDDICKLPIQNIFEKLNIEDNFSELQAGVKIMEFKL